MKSGGPWNLRGLRPEQREAARDAARQSGMSVGEWLNSVIQRGNENYGEPMRFADDDEDDDSWRDDFPQESRQETRHETRQGSRQEYRHEPRYEPRQEHRQEPRREYRQDYRQEPRRESRHEYRQRSRDTRRRQESDRDYERASAREREAALAQEEFGEVNARLDRLTQQLERMARSNPPRLTGAPAQPQRARPAPIARPFGHPPSGNRG